MITPLVLILASLNGPSPAMAAGAFNPWPQVPESARQNGCLGTWFRFDTTSGDYQLSWDQKHSEARVAAAKANPGGYATWWGKMWDPAWAGKKLRFFAQVNGKGTKSSSNAGMLQRVDDRINPDCTDGKQLAYQIVEVDADKHLPLAEGSGWRNWEVTVDVPADAKLVNFMLKGEGEGAVTYRKLGAEIVGGAAIALPATPIQ